MVLPLSQLDLGETAQVVWVASSEPMASRLHDLGFSPEERVSCVLNGRPGGMRAYLIRGAVIALRTAQSREIFVRV